MDLRRSLSSGFYPQANGQAERTNQMLKQILRTDTHGLHDWTEALDGAEMAMNNAEFAGSGYSPFYLNYGFHPCVWPDVEHAAARDLTTQDDVRKFVRRMETTWDSARALLDSASARSIAQANRQRRPLPELCSRLPRFGA